MINLLSPKFITKSDLLQQIIIKLIYYGSVSILDIKVFVSFFGTVKYCLLINKKLRQPKPSKIKTPTITSLTN